jgi:hypothetical protein
MAVTLDASTPAGVYNDSLGTTSLITAAFTPPNNSVLSAEVFGGDAGLTVTGVTASGLTFTSRINIGTAGTSMRVARFTAIGAGASVTATATFGGSGDTRGLIVKVWSGAQLAASPATHSVLAGTGAPSDSLTTAANGSVVDWISCDYNGIDPTGHTYRSSATEVALHSPAGNTEYSAYQSAATAGAQTYGLTAPVGQSFTMASIEIQASGAAVNPLPEMAMAPLRR